MSKKSNNKGYFLAETIVVIALVTSVMAYVFPNVTKVYDNYNNRSKYYDQTEDVYLLKAIAEYYESLTGSITLNNDKNVTVSYMGYLTFYFGNVSDGYDIETYPDNTGAGCLSLNDKVEINSYGIPTGAKTGFNSSESLVNFKNSDKYLTTGNYKLTSLYVTNYLSTPTTDDYNFNKYLNRLKKNTSDSSSYRLIGVFSNGNNTRYASVKVDNPNPKRNCNLGGSL